MVGETKQAAIDALDLIEVDYEELPAILTPEQAIAPGAAIIHEELESYFKVFPAIFGGGLLGMVTAGVGLRRRAAKLARGSQPMLPNDR